MKLIFGKYWNSLAGLYIILTYSVHIIDVRNEGGSTFVEGSVSKKMFIYTTETNVLFSEPKMHRISESCACLTGFTLIEAILSTLILTTDPPVYPIII